MTGYPHGRKGSQRLAGHCARIFELPADVHVESATRFRRSGWFGKNFPSHDFHSLGGSRVLLPNFPHSALAGSSKRHDETSPPVARARLSFYSSCNGTAIYRSRNPHSSCRHGLIDSVYAEV